MTILPPVKTKMTIGLAIAAIARTWTFERNSWKRGEKGTEKVKRWFFRGYISWFIANKFQFPLHSSIIMVSSLIQYLPLDSHIFYSYIFI
jgi:hypothetical protein